MKIFHIADIHLGDFPGPTINGENARRLMIQRALHDIADRAEIEEPDIILVAGDLFHKSKIWADAMLVQVNIIREWLKRLRAVTPNIIVLFGTGNHDNMKAFELMKDLDVYIVTEPENVALDINCESVIVSCVPGIDKRVFRSKITAADTTDENVIISGMLGDIVRGLAIEADEAKADYKILMAHYSVIGASMGNGQHIFNTSDVTLNSNTIDAAGFDLACLGHIHEPQLLYNILSTPTYYSGSIHRVSFTEEKQRKGFYIHNLTKGEVHSTYVDVPAYGMQTISLNQEGVLQFINTGDIPIGVGIFPIENMIVKILYECDSELDKRFNKKSLEEYLYSQGAFYVQEIRPEKITIKAVEKTLSEQEGVIENIIAYLKEQALPDGITIENIIEVATPLVQEVEASLNKNKSRGLFVPLSLEVNNYRKYKHEEFDFTKIDFAMVTGQNGAGKSSFFMDAVIDCLFEEPREGDLTGWISSDIDVRSGNIRFRFKIGSKTYEVNRSRTKSGKAGLSILEVGAAVSEDISELKKEDTQKKIVDILGMDSRMFKVCVMIMQDNYGLFLEASKDERMKILSRILGLEVYEILEKRFDNERLDHGRKVKALMEQVEKIDSELLQSGNIENDIENSKVNIVNIENDILKFKDEIAITESAWNNLKLLRDMKDKAEIRLKAYNVERINLKRAGDDHYMHVARCQQVLDKKEYYAERAAEAEQIAEETRKRSELDRRRITIEENVRVLDSKLARLENELAGKNNRVTGIKLALSRKSELMSKSQGIEELIIKKGQWTELSDKRLRFNNVVTNIKNTLNIRKIEFDNTKRRLETEIATLNNKVLILDNSNCIDATNAKCKFLEDAIKAKEYLPTVDESLRIAINEYNASLDSITTELQEAEKKVADNEELMKDLDIDLIEKELREKQEAFDKLKLLEKDEELLKVEMEAAVRIEVEKTEVLDNKQMLYTELGPIVQELNNIKFYDSFYLDKLRDDCKIHKNMAVIEEQLKNAVANKNNTDLQIQEVNRHIEEQEMELNDYKAKLSETDYEALKLKIEAYNIELRRLEKQKNDENIKLGALMKVKEDKKSLREMRTRLNEQITGSNRLRNIFSILKIAASMDGVPFMIVKSVLDVLTSIANDILTEMTAGKMKIEMLTEKTLKSNKDKEINALEVLISNPFNPELGAIPYLSRSGGEKVKAALAVAFALSELNAKRAGVQLGMMFVDEPPFLDEDGVQAYTDALEALSNKFTDMSVLAISHDPAMQSRFAQTIEVVNTVDGSKVNFNN